MNQLTNRRRFLKQSTAAAGSLAFGGLMTSAAFARDAKKPLFKISLAEWSLNNSIFSGKIDNRDFAKVAKREFGIDAIEYVNQFFPDKAKDKKYLGELKTRADGEGVNTLLIMIDREGNLGDPDQKKRKQAVENHHKWVEAAKFLGCHSIRVNAKSSGSYDEQLKLAADGLRQLSEFAKPFDMNVLVENHGGLSSNGKWLASVMKRVNLTNCGTLPDFGNFRIKGDQWYDRYLGVEELMPFAKAVSAKSHEFDAEGNDTKTDFLKMMKIVVAAGYHGYVGIEYEGNKLSEIAGITATQKLLKRVREKLST